MTGHRLLAFALAGSFIARHAEGQHDAIDASGAPAAAVSSVELRPDSPVRLTLGRPLAPDEGELALVVDGVDVTAVCARTASEIVYRPTAVELPAGRADIVLYRRAGSRWTELRRLTAIVKQAAAVGKFAAEQSATLGNNGQLVQRRTENFPPNGRRTFQDFTLNAGIRGTRSGPGWTLGTQSNFIGVTRREQALRFSTRGARAPMFDLSDYLVSAGASGVTASLGHVTYGDSRQLASGITARGTTVSLDRAGTSLRLAALSGASQLGWSDFTGLERANDRMFSAAAGREIVSSRPGALRLDLTLLDGSKLPISGATQSAVVDAQRSEGGSLQMTAALPDERARVTAGFSRSRFETPLTDPQLRDSPSFRRPAPATRNAHFVDFSGTVLQNTRVPLIGATTFALGLHDERVDPLYGSIAAQVAADRVRDAADATLSLGAISGQISRSVGRDNLARVPSILTTDDHATTASFAVPIATVAHAGTRGVWLPTLTMTYNQTHQFADGLPTNGQFRPVDLPNQLSTTGDATAAWQAGRLHLGLHSNRSAQDNRQQGRELADFAAGVDELSFGTALGARGDASIDLGDGFQTSKERHETTHTRHLRFNSTLTPRGGTSLVAALSLIRARPSGGSASLDTEQRFELSQLVRLWPGAGGGDRGQAFVRYARNTTRLAPPTGLLSAVAPLDLSLRQQWTLSSGFNVRVF